MDFEFKYEATYYIDGKYAPIFFGVILMLYIIESISLMRMFRKMGIEGWKAWAPIYNAWTFIKAGGYAGWWIFVPLANVVVLIMAIVNVAKGFGKSGAYALLAFVPLAYGLVMASKKLPWRPVTFRPLVGHVPQQSYGHYPPQGPGYPPHGPGNYPPQGQNPGYPPVHGQQQNHYPPQNQGYPPQGRQPNNYPGH
ncbi:MAG: DUF5684 domain-containing protein [Microbacteriaceae bacterium]|nr:DUF5684 domain-containing protein [Microbacteriaceae bacterium]